MKSRLAIMAAVSALSALSSAQTTYIWANPTGTWWGLASNWQAPFGAPLSVPVSIVEVNSAFAPCAGMSADAIIEVVSATGAPTGIIIGPLNSSNRFSIPAGSVLNVKGYLNRGNLIRGLFVFGSAVFDQTVAVTDSVQLFPGATLSALPEMRVRSLDILNPGSRTLRGVYNVRNSVNWNAGDVDGANSRVVLGPYTFFSGSDFPVATVNSGSWTDGQWSISSTSTLLKQGSGTVDMLRDVVSDGANTMTNNGTIDVQGGELHLYGTTTHTSVVMTAASSRIRLKQGTHFFNQGSSTIGNFSVDAGAAGQLGLGKRQLVAQ